MAEPAADRVGPEMVLNVGGREWAGWTELHVGRALDALAGAFTATVSEKWLGISPGQQIKPGDACTVAVDGEVVLTGWIDTLRIDYDANSHNVTVAGRDKTADLVDCSAVAKPGEWHGRTMAQIAAELAKPFGIDVVVQDVDIGDPFSTFAIEEGESVYEAIERMGRMRAVLPSTDGLGRLVLTQGGSARSTSWLKRGDNVLSGQAVLSWHDRYSLYIVEAQAPSTFGHLGGADPFAGLVDVGGATAASAAAGAHILEQATDPGVTRYRPLVVLAEEPTDGQNAEGRARWEQVVRAARARQLTHMVQGWREWGDQGALWGLNRLVEVHDDWAGIDGEDMLIAGVQFHFDAQGRRTELTLMPPGAFFLEGEKGKRLKKGRKGGGKGKGGADPFEGLVDKTWQ